jgi:hypothetical protein
VYKKPPTIVGCVAVAGQFHMATVGMAHIQAIVVLAVADKAELVAEAWLR